MAKEIERPDSYSLRTLELLRNISFEEAELFARLSEFVFILDEYSFVFTGDKELNKHGFNYYYLSKLKEAGLLQTGEGATRTFSPSKSATYTHRFICGNKFIIITIPPESKKIVLPIILLTQAGSELIDLTEHKDNFSYLKDFAAFFKKSNPAVSVKYGNILERDGKKITYSLPLIAL